MNLLARAIGAIVRERIAAGLGFIRVPEVVSPFPMKELLTELADIPGLRFAVFLEHQHHSAGNFQVTYEVHEAIRWRNDPSVSDNIVIVGDLERDRTAGLTNVPTISAAEVRRELINQLIRAAQARSASGKTIKLLQALRSDRLPIDLQYLEDYARGLLPSLGTNDLDFAASNLWLLRLLPDRSTTDLDLRRLRENAQRVSDLRQSDASTIQRLIRQLSTKEPGNYEALRLFASTGKRDYLRNLRLEAVRDAVRSAQANDDEEPGGEPTGSKANAEHVQFLEAVRAGSINEAEFLGQFDESEDDSLTNVSANGTALDWQRIPSSQIGGLLAEDGGNVPYAESAGSYEEMPIDEPDPLPGKGNVRWANLRDVISDLRGIEEGVEILVSPSRVLANIIELRSRLEGFSGDIPREGIRLFLAAPALAATAQALVDSWVDFWASMEELRRKVEEVGELLQIVRRIAVTDTRIVEQGTAIAAFLLPLHPMIIEPRVRAADMFRNHPELDQDFFRIVAEAIDPSVPSIKLPVQETTFDLPYSGQFRSLPQYERRAQQFHSPDVARALQDVVDRFVNVHPYARRSLRLALVDPTAETAKQVLKWLANTDSERRERIALNVYVQHSSPEEVGAKLAEAQEELISAEVALARFSYSVEKLNSINDLHDLIAQSDRSPHLLCIFDPAEVTSNATPIGNLTPVLGALVNEWDFGARKGGDATPYIRPRTGSSALSSFLAAQAVLLGTDTVGTTERTPLLPRAVLATLEQVGNDTTWVVIAQGASALVAPAAIGEMELLGRTSSGSHTAFVYSAAPALVLEPVLAYLQQHAYLQADVNDLVKFVLNTIRLALPEGLLGFYKRQGALSDESVLGRLGLAAVVAHLRGSGEDPRGLIVSLDTEGARRWLGLRDGTARRADLIHFDFRDGACRIEAIEIKTRSGTISWGASAPDAVIEAADQVGAIRELLDQVFSADGNDQLAASRREILKRQVFLEALHQWESLRQADPAGYRDQIRALNRIFAKQEGDRLPIEISERIFLVAPADERPGTDGVITREFDEVPVVQLGLDWFRNLLSSQAGGSIVLDPELLDMLDLEIGAETVGLDETAQDVGRQQSHRDNAVAAPRSSAAMVALPEGSPTTPGELEHRTAGNASPSPSRQPATQIDLSDLLGRLQASFHARRVPFQSISGTEAVVGPSVVQFPVRLEVGARTSQVESQADDIARDLGVQTFRIANFRGRPGYALAEVPRPEPEIPDVTTLSRPDLPYPALAIGAQLDFAPYWESLDGIPHLLIAGKTGSGKSVLVRSLLWQLTRLYGAHEIDLVLIGPKAADYMDFTKAPHFKSPQDVHLSTDGAIDVLREIVEVRYPQQLRIFDEYAREALRTGTRISNLRELMAHARSLDMPAPLRPFVVIIDEYVELQDSSPANRKEFETLIARFSRLFRYIGGTMIAATQRPSVKSITGDIKANFRPLALRVERSIDSRVILDEDGAEQLIGRGDLLYKSDDGLIRLQGYAALGTYLSIQS